VVELEEAERQPARRQWYVPVPVPVVLFFLSHSRRFSGCPSLPAVANATRFLGGDDPVGFPLRWPCYAVLSFGDVAAAFLMAASAFEVSMF
jgi:hypothetical protein